MASRSNNLPPALRARLREVPALAWTVAQAYSAVPFVRRQGRTGAALRVMVAAWAVPSWLIMYLPLSPVGVRHGCLARRDPHAVVFILSPTERRVPLGPFAILCLLWVLLSPLLLMYPLALVWPPLLWLPPVPMIGDVLGLASRHCSGRMRAGRGKRTSTLERRAGALAASGAAVLMVGLYAAHPECGRKTRRWRRCWTRWTLCSTGSSRCTRAVPSRRCSRAGSGPSCASSRTCPRSGASRPSFWRDPT